MEKSAKICREQAVLNALPHRTDESGRSKKRPLLRGTGRLDSAGDLQAGLVLGVVDDHADVIGAGKPRLVDRVVDGALEGVLVQRAGVQESAHAHGFEIALGGGHEVGVALLALLQQQQDHLALHKGGVEGEAVHLLGETGLALFRDHLAGGIHRDVGLELLGDAHLAQDPALAQLQVDAVAVRLQLLAAIVVAVDLELQHQLVVVDLGGDGVDGAAQMPDHRAQHLGGLALGGVGDAAGVDHVVPLVVELHVADVGGEERGAPVLAVLPDLLDGHILGVDVVAHAPGVVVLGGQILLGVAGAVVVVVEAHHVAVGGDEVSVLLILPAEVAADGLEAVFLHELPGPQQRAGLEEEQPGQNPVPQPGLEPGVLAPQVED